MPRCLIPVLLALSGAVAADDRPNFLIVMVDDMGYGDAGCFGGRHDATPALDRMAAEGMRWTDFHSSGCVCSPTRAGLLTGRYQQRAGIPGVVYAAFGRNRHHGLQHSEITLPEMLRDAGYQTAMFGKWHLGYERKYNPVTHGFDRFTGYVSGNIDFHAHIDGAGVFDWWQGQQPHHESGYTTHLITQHTCEFLQSAAAQDAPFFVYVAHEAPHDPYQTPEDPPVRKVGSGQPLWDHREPRHAATAYARMIKEMDDGLGQIFRTLQQLDQDRRTLVFFFSDNGATGPGSCGGLYGMKGTLWEGGHRVPAVVRWPGVIPAGTTNASLACSIDLMPTLLELADITPPSDHLLDGVSLVRQLRTPSVADSAAEDTSARKLFWEYGAAASMRDGRWKLVVNGGRPLPDRNNARPHINWASAGDGRDKLALFDLAADINEVTNLVKEHPDRVAAMRAAIETWREDVARGATAQPNRQTPNR